MLHAAYCDHRSSAISYKKNKHNRTNVVLNSNKLLVDSVFSWFFLVKLCIQGKKLLRTGLSHPSSTFVESNWFRRT